MGLLCLGMQHCILKHHLEILGGTADLCRGFVQPRDQNTSTHFPATWLRAGT